MLLSQFWWIVIGWNRAQIRARRGQFLERVVHHLHTWLLLRGGLNFLLGLEGLHHGLPRHTQSWLALHRHHCMTLEYAAIVVGDFVSAAIRRRNGIRRRRLRRRPSGCKIIDYARITIYFFLVYAGYRYRGRRWKSASLLVCLHREIDDWCSTTRIGGNNTRNVDATIEKNHKPCHTRQKVQ